MLHQAGRDLVAETLTASIPAGDRVRMALVINGREEPMPAQVGTGDTHREFVDRWRTLRAAFDDSSPLVDDLDAMDFSGALLALKEGHHLTRTGWNGTGLFVMLQAGYPDGIPINQNTAAATGLPQGTMCAVSPYLQLCKTGDRAQLDAWVPSTGDVLASDWRIVPRP